MRFNLLLLAVRVRTSTDRTGCTNFFRKKMHFLRAGVDKRFDAHKAPHPAATGQSDIMYCTRVPKVGTLVFFCLVPEYTENFAGKAKKQQNCNGKRKKPLLVAELLQLFLIKKNLSLPDETRGRETKAQKTGCF